MMGEVVWICERLGWSLEEGGEVGVLHGG